MGRCRPWASGVVKEDGDERDEVGWDACVVRRDELRARHVIDSRCSELCSASCPPRAASELWL